MPDRETFSRIIGALIVLYLAGLLAVAYRLKAAHSELWNSLGRVSLLNWGILNTLQLFRFVCLSGSHRQLGDRALSALIYALRLILLLTIGMIVVWMVHYGGRYGHG